MQDDDCNRRATANSLKKTLPEGVCLRSEKYAIDDIILDIDFNQDGIDDLIIRYFNFPYSIGDTVFYEFFLKEGQGFNSIGAFGNLYPPIRSSNANDTNDSLNTLSAQLVRIYPYSLSISFEGNLIMLSQRIASDYGKTHVFVFDNEKLVWSLDRIEFWAGNLDRRYWERLDLSEKLLGKVILETREPSKSLLLKDFNLIESRTIAEEIESDYLESRYDIHKIGRE